MYFVLNDSKIAVNVWHCKTREDDYVYELYVRPRDNMTEEEKFSETYTFFTSPEFSNITELFNLSMDLSECEHPNIRKEHKGRWLSKNAMSRKCVIEELNRLLPQVKSIIQGNT
jgi:DNA-binding transcriptional regulator of glucitol operon